MLQEREARRNSIPLAGHPGVAGSLYGRLLRLYLSARHRLESAARVSDADEARRAEVQVRTLLISLAISEDRRRALFSRLDAPEWRLSPIDACYPPDPDSLTSEEWVL